MDKPKDDTGFYEPYTHFSRTLRGWMVAYGIGVPVVLLSQDRLANVILSSGKGTTLTALFLGGVVLQVVAALAYKYSMAMLYANELDASRSKRWYTRLAEWLSDAFWLEFAIDALSIACFAWATFNTMQVVLGADAHSALF